MLSVPSNATSINCYKYNYMKYNKPKNNKLEEKPIDTSKPKVNLFPACGQDNDKFIITNKRKHP